MLKIAVVKWRDKIVTIYASPQLKGEIEIDVIDYDNLELTDKNKLNEMEIQEKILVECQ